MNGRNSAKFAAISGTFILAFAGTACVSDVQDDPGFNKSGVVAAFDGEVNSVDEYFEHMRKENERRLTNEGDVFSNPDGF